MSPYQNHATMHGHIAQWRASDLTQAAYCKEHGIKPYIFSYYKKKFGPNSAVTKHASQLVPVKLVADDAPFVSNLSSSSGLGVIRLTVSGNFPHVDKLSSLI